MSWFSKIFGEKNKAPDPREAYTEFARLVSDYEAALPREPLQKGVIKLSTQEKGGKGPLRKYYNKLTADLSVDDKRACFVLTLKESGKVRMVLTENRGKIAIGHSLSVEDAKAELMKRTASKLQENFGPKYRTEFLRKKKKILGADGPPGTG